MAQPPGSGPLKPIPPRRPLTLRDVSERSGVSEMTVSRVLRNRGDVSEPTRQKVLLAARELGYVPNRIAGALASQRVNLVGVVIPSLSNQVFPEVLQGLSDALEPTGLQPVIGVTRYSPGREEEVLYEMLSWRPAGLVVAGLEHSEAARAMMRAAGVPVVEIMDIDGTAVDHMVGISHLRAGRLMAQEILAAGYRRIGFLGPHMPADHRARKRMEGFAEVLREQGLSFADQEFYADGSALQKGREMAATLLKRTPDLDFLYCSSDLIGAGSLLHCLEAGFDVPGQIGLAGFNALPMIEGLPRRLATMDSCRRETGQQAAGLIAAHRAGDTAKGRVIALEPVISLGDTIRRA